MSVENSAPTRRETNSRVASWIITSQKSATSETIIGALSLGSGPVAEDKNVRRICRTTNANKVTCNRIE
jgi:hypothetical protein